jgi:hypothetical protein
MHVPLYMAHVKKSKNGNLAFKNVIFIILRNQMHDIFHINK